MPQNVYTGDEDGRVVSSSLIHSNRNRETKKMIWLMITDLNLQYEWDCVQRAG